MAPKKKAPHNRKLVLGGSILARKLVPSFSVQVASEVRDSLERAMIESDFLRDAPFEWISLIIRYGFVDQDTPHHEPINEAYGDLPLTIELDASGLRNASRAELRLAIEVAVLKALIDVGRRYELPYCAFQVRLTESEAQTL